MLAAAVMLSIYDIEKHWDAMRQTIVLVLAVILGLYVLVERSDWFFERSGQYVDEATETVGHLFANRVSNVQVKGSGRVKAVLKDDVRGSRHQRFILTLSSGNTLLISHNIDLAPRIDGLGVGDLVSFYGEYEWNEKGGVVHWTHHDPRKRHVDGWLKHNGRTYR